MRQAEEELNERLETIKAEAKGRITEAVKKLLAQAEADFAVCVCLILMIGLNPVSACIKAHPQYLLACSSCMRASGCVCMCVCVCVCVCV